LVVITLPWAIESAGLRGTFRLISAIVMAGAIDLGEFEYKDLMEIDG
jgi:hypothetical protein